MLVVAEGAVSEDETGGFITAPHAFLNWLDARLMVREVCDTVNFVLGNKVEELATFSFVGAALTFLAGRASTSMQDCIMGKGGLSVINLVIRQASIPDL